MHRKSFFQFIRVTSIQHSADNTYTIINYPPMFLDPRSKRSRNNLIIFGRNFRLK